MAAEKALKEAIEKGASADEIKKLTDNLQQALNDYARAKQDKQESNFANANQNQIPADIQEMMQKLQQLSEMGAKDAARKQMAELEQRLQQMRDQNPNGADDIQEIKDAEQLIQDMKRLQQQQADLLNKTFDKARQEETRAQQQSAQQRQNGRNQQPQNDSSSDPSGAQAAAEQEQLRQQLSQVMDRVKKMTGNDNKSMSEAQESMADARDALKGRAWQLGANGQSKALSKLQEGSEEAQQQIAQSLFDRGLGGLVEMPGNPQLRFQLGKRTGRSNGEDVTLPTGPDTAGMAGRVREILEEIRARASDRNRPAEERDYLKRLEKQF
jgi:DNA repair exonuclease SbcCD ATPase subunit